MIASATSLELRDAPVPDPLIPGYGLWPWWVAAGLLLLAALGVWMLLKRRGKAAVNPAEVREEARREAVAAFDTVKTADPRDAAVRASLILRKYLSVAARDPALFETHEEFIARHDALSALGDEARAAAGEGFARLARLKYAPDQPDAAAGSILTDSRRLLETLHHGFTA